MKPVALLLTLALSAPALAQTTVTWTGASSDDWSDTANWSPTQVPGTGDEALVPSTATQPRLFGSATTVGDLTIQNGASLTLDGVDLTVQGELDLDGTLAAVGASEKLVVQGDADLSSTSSYTAMTPLVLAGTGTLRVNSSAPVKPHVEVLSGTRDALGSTVQSLTLTGGTLHLRDFTTLAVLGDAQLDGGTLSFDTTVGNFDTLDVEGDLIQTGTAMGSTSTQSRIYVAGDWLADTPFVLASGWVYLDGGDSDIGGADPRFRRLQLQSGVNTLLTDVDVDGTIRTITGTSVGAGWFELSQTLEPVAATNDRLERVRVVGPGMVEFNTSLVGFLEVTGGTLHVRDFTTLSVTEDAGFLGGAVSFDNLVGNFDTIDVAGDVTAIGGTVSQDTNLSRLRVAGDWSGSASFVLPTGWVELDGTAATTIGGPAPTFGNLRVDNDDRTLLADTDVLDTLEIKNDGSLDVDTRTLTVTGTLDSGTFGAVISGTATIVLDGTGELKSHTEIPPVRITAGTRTSRNATVASLELVDGNLHLADFATLKVSGDALFTAGSLSFDTLIGNFDTLDVDGDLTQTGTTIGTTSGQSRIFCAGDWRADTPFVLASGWVKLDGGAAVIAGAAPAFKRLELDAGVKDVQSTVTVTGTIDSSGGSTTGPAWIELVDNTEPISTGGLEVAKLRVVSGYVPFATTTVGEFEMTGGGMLIQDFVTLKVNGDFDLLGGTLDFDTTVGNFDTIDIEGDFFQNGALLGTATDLLRIYCAGNWRSDTGFTLQNGWVYLDGLTDTTIDGVNPAFNSVRITKAKRTALAGIQVRGDLEVKTNATLELLGDLNMGRNLEVFEFGSSILGPGIIQCTGTGYMQTNATPLPPVHLTAGTREARTSTLEALVMAGGNLHIADFATCHVLGNADFGSGVLSFDTTIGNFDTLNIDGNLSQSSATIGSTTAQSRIFVAGDWLAANPFALDQGWVFLDGPGVIGGPAPTFKLLELKSGVRTVQSDAEITGTIKSTGGSTDGFAWLECVANTVAVSTGSNVVGRLRVAAGTIPFATSRIGELELTGGTLHVNDFATMTVDGDARLLGGELTFDTAVGNFDTLDVNGDLTESGTVAGTSSDKALLRVAGSWTGDGTYVLAPGRTELDGAGTTTIGGASPAFGDLRIAGGTRVLVQDTLVTDDLEVWTNATLDVAGETLEVVGDLDAQASGASVVGAGPVLLSGDGFLRSNSLGVPHVEVTGGTREARSATVADLTLTTGTLHLADFATLQVLGDAAFVGGSLSFDTAIGNFDTLDVEGSLVQTATTIGSTSAQSKVFVAGDWLADSTFELADGWVHLNGGDATIGGLAPAFKRLDLDSGHYTVASEATVSGTVTSTGGSTSGPEWLTMVGNVQPVSTATNLLGKVRVQAGLVPFSTSRLGELEVTGGELLVRDFATVTVDGDARLLGGTLSFDNTIGNQDTLDVNGSLLQTGTVIGTSTSLSRLRCAGDWNSNGSFVLAGGQVRLDGPGTTTLGGSIPGNDPTFPTLVITGGERRVESDTQLTATLVDVDTGARLTVAGDALRPVATAVSVDGTLDVEPGGRLAPDPASSITINPSGRLELLGTSGQPAVLEGLPGDLDCTVNGTLSARHFEVRAPAAGGLVVASGASLAAAPDDLRQGLFTDPAATADSRLLTLETGGGSVLPGLVFADPLAVGTNNVRRTTGGVVTLANAGGVLAGAAFEDDASSLVDWTSVGLSAVLSFTAKGGPEQATLSWESTVEAPALTHWRLESAPSPTGPFSLVTEVAATGIGTYAFVDGPLAADTTVHYRLLERQGAGLIGLVDETSVTPWSAAQPANVATVGPLGDFATIQQAVDAASGPAAVVSVAAGSYPSFSVLGSSATRLHVIADGSGPVLVDTSVAPVELALIGFGQTVELVGLELSGGSLSVDIHDNLGAVLLDEVKVTPDAGQTGVRAAASLAVNLARCDLAGQPALEVLASTSAYVGRGSVTELVVAAGATVQTAGVTPGSTSSSGTLVPHPGVMPDVQCGSFQNLGVPFSLDIDAAPASFYQLATAPALFPLDLGDPAFWQMLLLVHFGNYTVVQQGFTDPVNGQVNLTVALPADGAFIGAVLPVQAWTVNLGPSLEVRFSNMRTLVAMP